MPDAFLKLSAADRREAMAVAAAASGRPLHLLDKDVWLVWLLDVLFQSPFGQQLVFKGGSSLSKGYQIISRFSEDVDLTYDIRMLAPDLSGPGLDPLPETRSQEKRWTKEIRSRLPVWVTEQVMPRISAALADHELTAALSSEGEKVFLEYAPLAAGSGYVRPVVHARVWRALHRRAMGDPRNHLRRSAERRGCCLSVGHRQGHASGADVLGEGHRRSRILPARRVSRRRTLFAALA